jgi:hypothetical protein
VTRLGSSCGDALGSETTVASADGADVSPTALQAANRKEISISVIRDGFMIGILSHSTRIHFSRLSGSFVLDYTGNSERLPVVCVGCAYEPRFMVFESLDISEGILSESKVCAGRGDRLVARQLNKLTDKHGDWLISRLH